MLFYFNPQLINGDKIVYRDHRKDLVIPKHSTHHLIMIHTLMADTLTA